ncbi:MAG: hypothetical protein H0U19_14440, partial [Acidobacteria bacterium]|nr:hypothetical protein [Acidobacteriota bacterium]
MKRSLPSFYVSAVAALLLLVAAPQAASREQRRATQTPAAGKARAVVLVS